MPLAYFNYCRDIIRHKWPFRGFYLCSLGSFTRDAGLLYYRASGFWTGEWYRGCNTWIQLFKYRIHLHKQSLMCAKIAHLLRNPMSYYLVYCSAHQCVCLPFVWSGSFRSSDQFLEHISCSSGTFSLTPLSIFPILSSSWNFFLFFWNLSSIIDVLD